MSNRDFTMARLAAASAVVRSLDDDLRMVMDLFLDADEDRKGEKRGELLDGLALGCHTLAVAVQTAKQGLLTMNAEELSGSEDDYDFEEEEEDEDEDEEEEEDDEDEDDD